MSKIHIHRPHHLGLEAARQAAMTWAEKAEDKLDLECTYEEGEQQDEVCFSRPGVQGRLQVRADAFELHAQLGFLASAFKPRIEAELQSQFDAIITPPQAKTGRKSAKVKPS